MSFAKRIRYRFDTFMAKGGVSIFISLTIAFVVILTVLALMRGTLLWLFPLESLPPQHKLDFWGNIYITFLELTDPGNMAQDIYSSPWYKLIAVLAGLFGVVMFSALIAFITTALDQKINELKRGHSKIIEKGHTLILGWEKQRVIEIIRELIVANESEDDACIVVLAEKDKEEMDDILRLSIGDTKTTRLVTRSGNTSSLVNLDIVSVDACKSVIILAETDENGTEVEKNTSDAKVIQTILALTNMTKGNGDLCIVVEIYNNAYKRIVENTFPDNVVTVDSTDILAKLLVQTSRSVGLSVVYNEILSFNGCEMYFYNAGWGSITFKELSYHFPDGVPLGVRHSDGSLSLNPDTGYQMKENDDILILADDDSTIDFQSKPVAVPREFLPISSHMEQKVERELILGWTHKAPMIIQEYTDYVKTGSQIDIMLQSPGDDIRKELDMIRGKLDHLSINLINKDCLNTRDLMSVEPFNYDNIIILARGGKDTDSQKVDSENIVLLLLLRSIFNDHPEESRNTRLITEVLDSQNYPLISQAGVKDIIISNRLISMILAQISENRNIKKVYDDIFEESGSEIYLKPASLYFPSFPIEVTYADMMNVAHIRKEICLGIKQKENEGKIDQNFGIQLIPEKHAVFTLRAEDSLVVLAEDEL